MGEPHYVALTGVYSTKTVERSVFRYNKIYFPGDPMKVCDTTIFFSEVGGGIRVYLLEKQKYIRKYRKHDQHVIIVPGREEKIIEEDNTKIVYLKAKPFPLNPTYPVTFSIKKYQQVLEKEKPDIIEVGSPFISSWAAINHRKKYGTPIVIFFHTHFTETFLNVLPRNYQFLIKPILHHGGWSYIRKVYNQFNLILAPSRKIKTMLEQEQINKVSQYKFGVDIDTFHPDKRDLDYRKQIGASDKDIVFLFVGRLHLEKGIDIILKSFQQLNKKNAFLLIAGDGNERQNVEKFVKENPNSYYTGFLKNREEMAKVYASSDILILPSTSETFGMVYVEALSSGIPIVAIKNSGIVDELDPRYCFACNSNQIHDFVKGMEEAYDKREQINSREIHEYVIKAGYYWEKAFEDQFKQYEQLLKG